MTEPQHAAGGGAAGQPTVQADGPAPAANIPEELARHLPEGFQLPDDIVIVQVPKPTPEQALAGAVEHASMLRGLAGAARADRDRIRAANRDAEAEQDATIAAMDADADAAEQHARDLAGEHGLDFGRVPRHAVFAHLDTGSPAEGGAE